MDIFDDTAVAVALLFAACPDNDPVSIVSEAIPREPRSLRTVGWDGTGLLVVCLDSDDGTGGYVLLPF